MSVCVSLAVLAVDVAVAVADVVEDTVVVAWEDVVVWIVVVAVSETDVNVDVVVNVDDPLKTVTVVVVAATFDLVVVRDVIVGSGVTESWKACWMLSNLAWVRATPPNEESASFFEVSLLNSSPGVHV
mmetsp:Transcript_97320/g.253633  ORF Transcript_97320/g.253633 Transcript_97320/m.253633 type:complete len:128 (+) Transcript_97320:972-1355(+)